MNLFVEGITNTRVAKTRSCGTRMNKTQQVQTEWRTTDLRHSAPTLGGTLEWLHGAGRP